MAHIEKYRNLVEHTCGLLTQRTYLFLVVCAAKKLHITSRIQDGALSARTGSIVFEKIVEEKKHNKSLQHMTAHYHYTSQSHLPMTLPSGVIKHGLLENPP